MDKSASDGRYTDTDTDIGYFELPIPISKSVFEKPKNTENRRKFSEKLNFQLFPTSSTYRTTVYFLSWLFLTFTFSIHMLTLVNWVKTSFYHKFSSVTILCKFNSITNVAAVDRPSYDQGVRLRQFYRTRQWDCHDFCLDYRLHTLQTDSCDRNGKLKQQSASSANVTSILKSYFNKKCGMVDTLACTLYKKVVKVKLQKVRLRVERATLMNHPCINSNLAPAVNDWLKMHTFQVRLINYRNNSLLR